MKRVFLLPVCAALSLTGCASGDYNAKALQIGATAPTIGNPASFEVRQYNGVSQAQILSAATASMQDLGFTVAESSAQAGIVTGTKTRSAVSVRNVVGNALLAVALGVGAANTIYDKTQDIHITVVAAPAGGALSNEVRVAFDRSLINNRDQLSRIETVSDPQIYVGFFTQLDTALRAAPRS